MTTGEILRSVRKNLNLTQTDLGKKIGVSGSMIAQWENGTRLPKIGTISDIADALNIPISSFFPYDVDFDLDNFINNVKGAFEKIEPQDFFVSTLDGEAKIKYLYCKLNETGQQEAIKRVEELTRLKEYAIPMSDAAEEKERTT